MLKNSVVKIQITDYVGNQNVSRSYQDLTFSDDQETIISF